MRGISISLYPDPGYVLRFPSRQITVENARNQPESIYTDSGGMDGSHDGTTECCKRTIASLEIKNIRIRRRKSSKLTLLQSAHTHNFFLLFCSEIIYLYNICLFIAWNAYTLFIDPYICIYF